MNRPPILHLSTAYHVGDLDPSSKRDDSYEGAGLSICRHPGAWRGIARGHVTGTTHRMTCDGASFVDAHSLDEETRRAVLSWGVEQELAESTVLWTMSWDDDDGDGDACRSWCVFGSEAEADAEAEEHQDSGVEVVRSTGHASTARLDSSTRQTRRALGDAALVDLLLPLWAHQVHGIDGVWWDERLDPLSLSAPRGVIRPESIARWSIRPIDHDPDQDGTTDDGEDGEGRDGTP